MTESEHPKEAAAAACDETSDTIGTPRVEVLSQPHIRLAVGGVGLLVWLGALAMAWLSWPTSSRPTLASWSEAGDAVAQKTRLGRAIKGAMGPHIPQISERKVIWAWIASPQQRHHFYRDVWPILKARCHACHGSFHRPKGAMPMTRLAHILPLVRGATQGSLRRQMWVSLTRQLPLLGGLLLLLALLLGSRMHPSPLSRGVRVWVVVCLLGLLDHLCGIIAGGSRSWGIQLSMVGLALFAIGVTALTFALLWRCLRPVAPSSHSSRESS